MHPCTPGVPALRPTAARRPARTRSTRHPPRAYGPTALPPAPRADTSASTEDAPPPATDQRRAWRPGPPSRGPRPGGPCSSHREQRIGRRRSLSASRCTHRPSWLRSPLLAHPRTETVYRRLVVRIAELRRVPGAKLGTAERDDHDARAARAHDAATVRERRPVLRFQPPVCIRALFLGEVAFAGPHHAAPASPPKSTGKHRQTSPSASAHDWHTTLPRPGQALPGSPQSSHSQPTSAAIDYLLRPSVRRFDLLRRLPPLPALREVQHLVGRPGTRWVPLPVQNRLGALLLVPLRP